MEKLYIVTGAAGHLGSTIVRLFAENGQRVRGLLLSAEVPPVAGAEYVRGDVREPESMIPLFQRGTGEQLVVIHTAGLIDVTGEMSRWLYDVNVTGTKNILALCQKYHADKLVYVSSVHAIPETGRPTVQTEITRFSPETVLGGYAKTKAEATQAVLNAATHGLPVVVVHPSGIIGPYDEGRNHLVQMVRDFMEDRLPVCVKGGYDLVDVRDVAEGCILASGLDRIVYLLEQGIIDNSVLNLIERRWAERLTLEQAKCILTLLVESKINDGKYHFFCIGCEWLKTFTQPEFAEFLFTHSAHLSFDVLRQHSYEFIRLMEQLPEVILRDCLVLVIRSIDYSYRMRYLVEHIRYIQKHANGTYARDIAFEVCNCIYAHSEDTVLETSCAGLIYLLCTENVLQWIDIEQQKRAEVIAFHLPAPSLSEVSVPEVTQRVLEQYEKNETVFHRFWRGIHACESYSYSEIEESCKRKFAILKQYGEHPSKPIRKWADFEKKRIETLLDEKRRLDAEEMRFRES